jgi:hypothetical protein
MFEFCTKLCRRLLDRLHLHSPEPNVAHLWSVYASLSSGEPVGVDVVEVVVSATGVKLNVPSWLLGGKVELDEESGGILFDERMETSAVGVYAAGNASSPRWGEEGSSKHWMQMRLWTQARQFGLYTGKAMYLPDCSLHCCFQLFSHSARFFGFKVVLLGLFNAQGLLHDPLVNSDLPLATSDLSYLLRISPERGEYIKCVLQDGRLQGAILVGDTGLEETLENHILNQIDLTPFGDNLLNPDIDIEDYFD